MIRRKLKWGETPFDDLFREDLIRHCQRMFSALTSARSILAIGKASDPTSPYWGLGGTGGGALEKCDRSLALIQRGFDEESIYRAFFRYADDLLFAMPRKPPLGHSEWYICPECKAMSAMITDKDRTGEGCGIGGKRDCKGALRRIIWDDLRPTEASESEAG